MQQTSKTNILTFSPELARKVGLNKEFFKIDSMKNYIKLINKKH